MKHAATVEGREAPREVEIKLELDPGAVETLKGHPALAAEAARVEGLSTVYFDTPDQALRQAGLSLRVRRVGERRIQTVKSGAAEAAGLFDRSEWEHDIAGDGPDLAAAAGTALETALTPEQRMSLGPVFALEVERTTYPVRLGRHGGELTLDIGEVRAGTRTEALCEVELETRRGKPAALFAFARRLTEAAPLRLGVRTKAERGYALLKGRALRVAKGGDPGLTAGMRTDAAFQAIGRACLAHFIRNEPVLRARRDPDAVHQMRVALRRLRAAISLFRPVVEDERRTAVAAELKWFAGELGDARDLDVLIADVLRPLAAEGSDAGLPDLLRRVEADRDAAYGRALAALASDRFRLMVLDTAAWIESGPWLRAEETRKVRRQRIEAFAADVLRRRRRRVRRRGEALADLSPEARHEVRIEVKKLRYAAEFFRPLFGGPTAVARRKAFLPALETLQEALGILNDVAVGSAFQARFADEPALADSARRIAERQRARGADALAPALEAYRVVADAEAFWSRADARAEAAERAGKSGPDLTKC